MVCDFSQCWKNWYENDCQDFGSEIFAYDGGCDECFRESDGGDSKMAESGLFGEFGRIGDFPLESVQSGSQRAEGI